jgi:fluoride ion exporter CrcB/FEX
MPTESRSSTRDVASIIVGSAVGAVIRYAAFQTWLAPAELLTATIISGISGFALAGFVLASQARPEVRAFVAGVCGAITSVSAYVAVGISQPPWVAIAVITLMPVSIVAGLIGGALVGISITGRRKSARAPK